MTDAHAITNQEQLQALYATPRELVLKKVADRIDPRTADFIAASPFCLLSTFGARGPHCTPRGDAPGFIDVLDETTLALPDRRGNNRIDALRDVIDNPAVALLFLVPGAGETLRVAGSARLTADPALRERYTVQGQVPATVLLITVEEVFMQCQRAILRSRLWGERAKAAGVPSAGQLLQAHTKGLVDAVEYDAEAAPRVSATLY
ncbi:MAG: flavin-nucleotide-binding protein [Roseomonas sp.]|jgi:PPOX class probable FMN-dependent enzyme|nr:flavin-nucleotide-binding protein [Roseomonas sp.]